MHGGNAGLLRAESSGSFPAGDAFVRLQQQPVALPQQQRRAAPPDDRGVRLLDARPDEPRLADGGQVRRPTRSTRPTPRRIQIPAHGDGQSYIQTIGVSADGQRVVSSVNGPAEPDWHNLVGRPDGGEGFGMWGDFGTSRASGTVVVQSAARYVSFATYFTNPLIVSDVTTLPTQNSQFQSLNLASETTSLPAGYALSTTGGFVLYLQTAGTGVQIIDASSPGPAGNIQSGFKTMTLGELPGRSLRASPEQLHGGRGSGGPDEALGPRRGSGLGAGRRELAELRPRLDQQGRERKPAGAGRGRRAFPRAVRGGRDVGPLGRQRLSRREQRPALRPHVGDAPAAVAAVRALLHLDGHVGPDGRSRRRLPRASASRRRAPPLSPAAATASTSTCRRDRRRGPCPSRARP